MCSSLTRFPSKVFICELCFWTPSETLRYCAYRWGMIVAKLLVFLSQCYAMQSIKKNHIFKAYSKLCFEWPAYRQICPCLLLTIKCLYFNMFKGEKRTCNTDF